MEQNRPLLRKKSWKVVYTRSNYEKKANQLLTQQGIQSFCPLVVNKSKWADRIKIVEKPLFPSYLFVYVSRMEEDLVLAVNGILNYVSFCGKAATIPENDITRIREILASHHGIQAISKKKLLPGDKVFINNGFKKGATGEIIDVEEKTVLLVLNEIDCALIAKIRIDINNILPTSTIKLNNPKIN